VGPYGHGSFDMDIDMNEIDMKVYKLNGIMIENI